MPGAVTLSNKRNILNGEQAVGPKLLAQNLAKVVFSGPIRTEFRAFFF